MSKATREVWHCDICGWEWLPDTSNIPRRCPNRKCRKRNWNNPALKAIKEFRPDPTPSLIIVDEVPTNWDLVWQKTKKK